MALTESQIALVRSGFDRIRANLQPPSTYFYEALFRRKPEYRELFREDIAGQGMRFMSTLAIIVDNLDKPELLQARFEELGHAHAAMGIEPQHFAPMEEALVETLREELGDALTPEAEQAWRTAYEDVSRTIMSKGGIA